MDEAGWKKSISEFETDFDSLETNKKRAKRVLGERLVAAVKANAVPNCGVLFSGGIDSTLISFILKKLGIPFTCYAVGIENSQDVEWAERIAKEMGFKLKIKILTLEEFENVVKSVVKILKTEDVMKVSVGAVTYAAMSIAKADGVKAVFTGLGSEELFAGYQRHEEALKNGLPALHKECFIGLMNMWERDIVRDTSIAKTLGVDVKVPFLDKEVISYAMKIHPMHKMDNENKKIIIREIAYDMGLPKEYAWRKKKAAQYGSNFIKGLDKLAKKNGFDLKKEYLKKFLSS